MEKITLNKMKDLAQNLSSNIGENTNFHIFDSSQVPTVLQQRVPFRNDFYILMFIIKGTIDITIDFQHHKLDSEQVAFISPKQVIEVDDKDVELGFGILFRKEFLLLSSDWLQDLPLFNRFHSNPWLNLSGVNQTLLSNYINQMLDEHLSNNAYKFDIIKAHLVLVLAHLSRIYSESKTENEPKSNTVILQFESLIEKHHQTIKSVKEYAEMLYMTPQNLNRICTKITGLTASELINKKVLIEVKRFLIFTNNSIEEIGYSFSFYDNSYFTKYFKKATGMTPKKYRALNSK